MARKLASSGEIQNEMQLLVDEIPQIIGAQRLEEQRLGRIANRVVQMDFPTHLKVPDATGCNWTLSHEIPANTPPGAVDAIREVIAAIKAEYNLQ